MQTETLDKLYLEWSQFTKAKTAKELTLEARIEALEKAYSELRLEAEVQLIMLACAGVEKLTEIEPDAGWDRGETVAAMYISQLPAPLQEPTP